MAHLRRPASVLFLVLAIVPLTACSFASPLPPLISASQSANGQWLVVLNWELGAPGSDGGQPILRTTYRVLKREPFLNGRDRLEASVPFWSEQWTISFPGPGSFGQSWPLISDDGKSLVLVSVVIPAPHVTVLAIYREHPPRGELVRAIKLSDLWTPRQIDPKGNGIVMDKGVTPQWFAGSHFAFSANASTLIYRDRWSSTKFIDLRDGTITSRR